MQPRLLPWAAVTIFITIGKTGERVVMSHVLENGHESVPFGQIVRWLPLRGGHRLTTVEEGGSCCG
jgi:hypothetical protein